MVNPEPREPPTKQQSTRQVNLGLHFYLDDWLSYPRIYVLRTVVASPVACLGISLSISSLAFCQKFNSITWICHPPYLSKFWRWLLGNSCKLLRPQFNEKDVGNWNATITLEGIRLLLLIHSTLIFWTEYAKFLNVLLFGQVNSTNTISCRLKNS